MKFTKKHPLYSSNCKYKPRKVCRKNCLKIMKQVAGRGYPPLILFLFLFFFLFLSIPASGAGIDEYYKAEVLEIKDPVFKGEEGRERVKAKLISGKYAGSEIYALNLIWEDEAYNIRLKKGDKVLVKTLGLGQNDLRFFISGHYRSPWVFALISFFIFIFLALVGWRRWPALLALLLNICSVIFIIIPLIKKGYSPFFTVLFIQGLVAALSLRLILGGGRKFSAALLGSVVGVAFGGIIAYEFMPVINVSGLFLPGSRILQTASRYISGWNITDFRGLFASVVMIASMGAAADIGASISSGCWHISLKSDLKASFSLFKAGMNIGSDITATMLNSLVLAFTGLALPLIALVYVLDIQFLRIINFEVFTALASSAIISSIAMVISVPVTSFFCGILFVKK